MSIDGGFWETFICWFVFFIIFYIFFKPPIPIDIFKCDEVDCMYETYNKTDFVKHVKTQHTTRITIKNIYKIEKGMLEKRISTNDAAVKTEAKTNNVEPINIIEPKKQ